MWRAYVTLWAFVCSVAVPGLTACSDSRDGDTQDSGEMDPVEPDAFDSEDAELGDDETVTLPPTGTSDADIALCGDIADDAERDRCFSLATLRELYRLVYNCETYEACVCPEDQPGESCSVATANPYPGGSRTIQLQPGVYDLGGGIAVVDPDDPGPPPASEFTLDAYFGDVYTFNPLRLDTPSSGLLVAGRENLTIQGAEDQGTTLVGQGFVEGHPYAGFDGVLLVTGWYSTPSRHITIRGLRFEHAGSFVAAAGATEGDAFNPPGVAFGPGVEDLLVENNVLRMDGSFGVVITGSVRAVVRNNTFYTDYPRRQTPHFMLPLHVISAYSPNQTVWVTDATIEDNTLRNVERGITLWDHHEGTVVRGNSVRVHPKGLDGMQVVVGTHGGLPHFPADSGGSIIEGNTISGGRFGISLWGAEGWTVRDNRVSDCEVGVNTDWHNDQFWIPDPTQPWPAGDTVHADIPTTGCIIEDNRLLSNGIGVKVGPYTRDNVYEDNEVGTSTDVGYLIAAPYTYWDRYRVPSPSGNRITLGGDDTEPPVRDLSGCTNVESCDQSDWDNNGTINDDPVNRIDDNGDGRIDSDADNAPNTVQPAD